MSDVVAANIREARKQRGWKPAELAVRCRDQGSGFLTENVIENIESGRRRDGKRTREITVDELLALAYALDVAPVHLMAGLEDDEAFPVTPSLSVDVATARRWMRGFRGLAGTDLRYYRGSSIPASEVGVHWRMVRQTDNDLDEVIERSQRQLEELEQIKRNRDEGVGRGERIAAEIERARRDRDEGKALSPEILADLERIERSQDEGAEE